MKKTKHEGPRVLFLDIETAPLLVHTWGLFDQNIALNQIVEDTFILSWAAKWRGEKKVYYMDQRNNKVINKDCKKLLKGIWKLLDEADIVVGQNSKRFDVKKLNTAFVLAGMQPPSSFKQIDTLAIAKRNFALTSNKLEFTTEKLCTKYKKLKHGKFPGFSLWTECLKGNKAAWKEMQKYNEHDVLATEEYWEKIQAWDATAPNFSIYNGHYHHTCKCGGTELRKKGFFFSPAGKFQRYKCKSCGAESRDGKNMLDKEKCDSLKRNTTR